MGRGLSWTRLPAEIFLKVLVGGFRIAQLRALNDTVPEKTRPLATAEQDIRLMSSAGAADSALGREMLRVLAAA